MQQLQSDRYSTFNDNINNNNNTYDNKGNVSERSTDTDMPTAAVPISENSAHADSAKILAFSLEDDFAFTTEKINQNFRY